MILQIVPAHGRKYTCKEDILNDWNSGKDFKLFKGPYISIRDVDLLAEEGYTSISCIISQEILIANISSS